MTKKRILAVDDNAVNLATLEKELSEKYKVIPMISGRRAVKFLCCEKVDLILLDIEMPVMDGIQTLREIRTIENAMTVPVVFLTANKDKKTVIEGSKLGIMDYITKPFDIKTLVQRIDYVFKRIGQMPFETEEIYTYLGNILLAIRTGKIKQAIISCNELIQCQVDDEISGRMMNARNKLDNGDTEGAVRGIMRIQKMLEVNMGVHVDGQKMKVSDTSLIRKIDDIIEDIKEFRTKEAIEKCITLRNYELTEEVQILLTKVIDCLRKFDDESAEEILRSLQEHLGKQEGA